MWWAPRRTDVMVAVSLTSGSSRYYSGYGELVLGRSVVHRPRGGIFLRGGWLGVCFGVNFEARCGVMSWFRCGLPSGGHFC